MHNGIRLSPQKIKVRQENALDLFVSGIKADETKRTMTRNLRIFLVDACADLLEGTFEQRAQQFVDMTREDQQRATQIILMYISKLREKTLLEKADPAYLNPSSIPNRVKPMKKLLEMNNLGLGWKRIYTTYPEKDNTNQGRGYTREEIQKMLEFANYACLFLRIRIATIITIAIMMPAMMPINIIWFVPDGGVGMHPAFGVIERLRSVTAGGIVTMLLSMVSYPCLSTLTL